MINKIRGKLWYWKKWTKIYSSYLISKIRGRKYWKIKIDDLTIKLSFSHPYQHMVGKNFCVNGNEINLLIGWKKLAKKSAIILDIGGYNAVFSIIAAKANPEALIYIFEPDTINLEHIRNNITLNDIKNIEVIESVVYSKSGSVNFREHSGGGGGNIDQSQNKSVRSTTIDDWFKQTGKLPNLIKMDIEGAEQQALLGARSTLMANNQLTILLEVHQKFLPSFGNTEKEIFDYLDGLNYRYISGS